MKKLFSIECKRAILSPFLWIAACIPIGLNLYGIVLSSYGFTITASGFSLRIHRSSVYFCPSSSLYT